METAAAASILPVRRQLLAHRVDAIITAPTVDAIADAAIARVIDLDAASEQRRREGHDVDNEPLFKDLVNRLKAGQPPSDEEQAGLDALMVAVRPLTGDQRQA